MSKANTATMHARNIQKVSVRQQIGKAAYLFLTYAFLILMAAIVLFPFYWMLISSLKTLEEYRRSSPTFWPMVIVLRNYVDAFTTANLGRLFINTLIVGGVSTLLSLVITI